MASFTFLGREYKMDDFLRDVILMAQDLAKNARLDQPLPPDTDLTNAEQKEIQDQVRLILPGFVYYITVSNFARFQIRAMAALPTFAVVDFWSAFAAHHLGKLASALRSLSHTTQIHALSTLIQIFSLLPDPKSEPYFRGFLQSPKSNGLATLVAVAFVLGIEWKRPSGPGQICGLINHFLIWDKSSQGDDGKAPIDSEVRTELAKKLDLFLEEPKFNQLPEPQRVEIQRLRDTLKAIEAQPEDKYLRSTREHLEGQANYCAKESCLEDAESTCARCKSVKYCGKKCQTWHWKNGHKLRCFQATY